MSSCDVARRSSVAIVTLRLTLRLALRLALRLTLRLSVLRYQRSSPPSTISRRND